MTPQEERRIAAIKQRLSEGKHGEALQAHMAYLFERALEYLDTAGYVVNISHAQPPPPLAAVYRELALQVAELAAPMGDASPVELQISGKIFFALANTLEIITEPGPVDGERIARLMLSGMDLSSLSFFCSRLDTIPDEASLAADAEKLHAIKERQRMAGKDTSAALSGWHLDGFAGMEAYRYFNPNAAQKEALGAGIVFVTQRSGGERKDNSLAQAISRKPAVVEQVRQVVREAAVGNLSEGAPAELMEAVRAALDLYRAK